MPSFALHDGANMHYEKHDFTDPWKPSQALLLVHGVADSSNAWFPWIPAFSRDYQIICPDLRGFGQSSPNPESYHWTLDKNVDDLIALLDHCGIEKCHLVGAKMGCAIAIRMAARHPDRIMTLSVMGAPITGAPIARDWVPLWLPTLQRGDVEAWARDGMSRRTGAGLTDAQVEWWSKSMAAVSPVSTLLSFFRHIGEIEVSVDLTQLAMPTLVMASKESALGDAGHVKSWQETIPNSELALVSGGSYHLLATHPDESATIVREFLSRHS